MCLQTFFHLNVRTKVQMKLDVFDRLYTVHLALFGLDSHCSLKTEQTNELYYTIMIYVGGVSLYFKLIDFRVLSIWKVAFPGVMLNSAFLPECDSL